MRRLQGTFSPIWEVQSLSGSLGLQDEVHLHSGAFWSLFTSWDLILAPSFPDSHPTMLLSSAPLSMLCFPPLLSSFPDEVPPRSLTCNSDTNSSNAPRMVALWVRPLFSVLLLKPEPFFLILLFIDTAVVCFLDTLPCKTEQLEGIYDRPPLRNSKQGPDSEKMFGEFLSNNARGECRHLLPRVYSQN